MGSNGSHSTPAKEVALQMKRAETGEFLTTCALVDLDGYLTDALTQVLLAKVKLNGNNEAEPHIARTSEILQQGRSMTQEILGAQPPSTVQIGRLDLNQIVRKAGRSFLTWAPENIELQLLACPCPASGSRRSQPTRETRDLPAGEHGADERFRRVSADSVYATVATGICSAG